MPRKSKKESGNAEVRRVRRRQAALNWRMPPLPWILSAGRAAVSAPPRRILVGGCIQEALVLAKSLPACEIVAIDSSQKHVRAMRLSAQRRKLKNLSPLEASLDHPHLAEATGRNFDLAILPGFSTPAQDLVAALANLTDCVSRSSGTVYIRISGESHPFQRSREILGALGKSPRAADESEKASPLMLLAASLAGDTMPESTPFHTADFSLPDWTSAFRTAGFHFVSSLHVPAILARGLSAGGVEALVPRGNEELAVLLDRIAPPVERHLLFSTETTAEPSWQDPKLLAEWRPAIRFWPRGKIPPQSAPFNRVFSVDLEIQRVLPKFSLQLSAYMLELLRLSDGATSLRDLMDRIPHEATVEDLLPALWFFHQSCIATLQPPGGTTSVSSDFRGEAVPI
jgi:hypothetical protein